MQSGLSYLALFSVAAGLVHEMSMPLGDGRMALSLLSALMKGRIEVMSKEGEGRIFTLIIPLLQTQNTQAEDRTKGI
ncbi:hypothetical protein GCM10009112_02800 [Marinomonas arenicola]|uniref:hypothetical protein n=1 Tax=Marinomonas TaxID=28253 RepID=UPI0010561CD3|nr:hypothetical protein [Marinomonas sp. KMM3893]